MRYIVAGVLGALGGFAVVYAGFEFCWRAATRRPDWLPPEHSDGPGCVTDPHTSTGERS